MVRKARKEEEPALGPHLKTWAPWVLLVVVVLSFLAYLNNRVEPLEDPAARAGSVIVIGGEKDQPPPLHGGAVEVHFTPWSGMEDRFADFCEKATTTLDAAMYELKLPTVAQALVAASERGVRVRLVMESGNDLPRYTDTVKAAGIPVRGDGRSAQMHNKFVIADGRRVWTGSMNFTPTGIGEQDNNIVIIDSTQLAANYLAEFEEMWGGQYGITSPPGVPYQSIEVNGAVIENYFGPEDAVMAQIMRHIQGAQESVDIMIFAFSHKELAAVLQERIAAGVRVRCLFDHGMSKQAWAMDEPLAVAGADVRRGRIGSGKVHAKTAIVDNATVITGSVNFSKNADKSNDENLLVIRSPEVAAAFTTDFETCWSRTGP